MVKVPRWAASAFVFVVCCYTTAAQGGGAIVSGFDSTKDGRNDDGTYTAPLGCTAPDDGQTCSGTSIDIGFTVNFFGVSFSKLYVNTNGNVTLDSPLPAYSPFNLTSTNRQLIAPFFADVDTRNPLSGTVSFGRGSFGGRDAFGVNWINVGYYRSRVDKKNSFQLILVNRSDTGAGNFDIVFNYGSIQWETGEGNTNGGSQGLGGKSARAGYSNGTGSPGTSLELRGSAIPGSFLDSNLTTGLIRGSLNSDVLGRYIFMARNGQIIAGSLSVVGPCPVPNAIRGVAYTPFSIAVSGGTPPYTYTPTLPAGLAFDANTLTVSGTPTAVGDQVMSIDVADSGVSVLQQIRTYTCSLSVLPAPPPLQISGPCTGGTQNSPYLAQLSISGGMGGYSVAYRGPSWLAPGPSSPLPGVYRYTLSGTPPFAGSFPVSVTATDSSGTTGVYNCTIAVSPRVKITSGCPTSTISQGLPFTFDLTAEGGTAPIVWGVPTGQLPPGLNLNNAGRVFGTPSGSTGVSIFTIGAYSGGIMDQKACSINVVPRLALTSACPTDGTAGSPYGPFYLTATGGLGTGYEFSTAGTLPDGVSIVNSAITGTPQKSGLYSFAIKVSTGALSTTGPLCSVNINPRPLDISGSCPATVQQVGAAISATFSGVGGQAPYSFSLSGPPWLSLTNGVVTGTVPATAQASTSFVVTIMDAARSVKTKVCALNLTAAPSAPSIAGFCPAPLQSTSSIIQLPLAVSGGVAPFTWTYDGTPDLSLQTTSGSNTAITGTLVSEGSSKMVVNVRDGSGARATPLACAFTVIPANALVTLSPASVPADLLRPVPVTITLAAPTPVAVDGTLALTFSSSANFPVDNREVTMTGGRAVGFTIPAGGIAATVTNVQRGTVAGVIHVELTDLRSANSTFSFLTAPALDVPVSRMPPVFTVALQDTPSGIDVVLKGYSTTRDILGGSIRVNGKKESTFAGLTQDLDELKIADLFADYYKTKTGAGSFDEVRIPIALTSGRSEIESVTVTLRNSAGSAEVTQAR